MYDANLSWYSAKRTLGKLVDEGYLNVTENNDSRRTKRTYNITAARAQEILYGLTWLGYIASLALESIRKKAFHAFELHMNTIVADEINISGVDVEGGRLARGFLAFLRTAYTDELIYASVTALLLGYVDTSAPPLDEMMTARLQEWMPWIEPIIANAALKLRELPEYEEKTVNLFHALDDSELLDFVILVLPIIIEYLSKQIRAQVGWLIAADGLREVFENMTPDQRPSILAEDFVTNTLPKLYENYDKVIREYEEGAE